jgi:RimJ/RimL family protein N-acetyltransferase
MGQINSDTEVTRYLNRPVGPAATSAFQAAAIAHWDACGFGFWAVESVAPDDAGALLGFVGMAHPTFLPELARRVEIGWRLARSAWGRGLATEGAIAARDHALDVVGLNELISIIHPENERSRRVATKLGMTVERRVHHTRLRRDVEVWALEAPSRLSAARGSSATPRGPA